MMCQAKKLASKFLWLVTSTNWGHCFTALEVLVERINLYAENPGFDELDFYYTNGFMNYFTPQ